MTPQPRQLERQTPRKRSPRRTTSRSRKQSLLIRWIAAGADEIERERAAGMITSRVPSRTLAATLFWGTERVLYIAGQGVEAGLADEEAAVDALVTMWRGTLYAL